MMDAYIYDTSFNLIKILDDYNSFIWTERYSSFGDFELYLAFEPELLTYLQRDNYIGIRDSHHMMVIESVTLKTDIEEGAHLTVQGRSLESILDRRIIWKQTNISGKLQNGVKKLLNENVISPSASARRIDRFVFIDSDDPYIIDSTFRAQYTGDNLYEALVEICDAFEIGFRVLANDEFQFEFSLYNGADHSFEQEENPYVIFSPKYENLYGSTYTEATDAYKSVTLVAGEGEGASRKTTTVLAPGLSSSVGLNRRELYTDARDISSDTDEGTLTPEEYTEQLKQRGRESLAENVELYTFDGELDTSSSMYKLNRDYAIGDIVQVRNEYGLEAPARIIEFIRTEDENGYAEYPTFQLI